MELTPEVKKRIDDMSYYDLLYGWRFSHAGNEMFQGESGQYYSERMFKMRDEISNDEHVRISKAIGWER
jgi:hypothetical protein